jgi:CDP-diacylglycerol--serine O-phosphatidyltransferase
MSTDPIIPRLEEETRRRRRLRMFSHSRIPVRMMVPSFFTLLGLCAGLTSIRMSVEGRWDLAIAAIVFAAMLDGIDGRVARLLKASSRFGAELDSLADFVDFGVAPAILIFCWAFRDIPGIGWICVMIFALASALRLARFNVAIDGDKPKWQSNYFSGMPTPAAAIVVMLPVYLANFGLDARTSPLALNAVLVYTLAIALMMVSIIPTYSGKLLGERIGREWVLPIFIGVVALMAHLVTYPFATLTAVSLAYLAVIPFSWRRYHQLERQHAAAAKPEAAQSEAAQPARPDTPGAEPRRDAGRVVDMRAPGDPKR